MFKGAGGGGSGGDDSAAFGEGAVEGVGGGGGEGVALGVEADVGEAIDADGLEGSETDVEGEGCDFHAAGAEGGEDLGREVEAGGGGGGRAERMRVDGLVSLAVLRGVGLGGLTAVDVGGKGHVADAGERGVEVRGRGEAEGALAEGAGGEDFGGEEGLGGAGFRGAVKEEEGFAGADLAGGADEDAPEIFGRMGGGAGGLGFGLGFVLVCDLFGEEDFDEAGGLGRAVLGARADAGGEEARWQDAGVVENEEIAGLEELREIGEEVVAECSGGAVEDEHTAGAALGGRVLGDEFGGQVVMEVGDEHWVGIQGGSEQVLNIPSGAKQPAEKGLIAATGKRPGAKAP